MSHYDYIILGAGASGLLLADAMGQDPFFDSKSILVLEKESKSKNDRTWCFWEKGQGDFDSILHKKWENIYIAGEELRLTTLIAPYSYKMIRGIDFYDHYVPTVKSYRNITWVEDAVTEVKEDDQGVFVKTVKAQFTANFVFNSIVDLEPARNQHKYPVLQQHFLGWFIQTENPVFDTETATFMDFSIPQKGNTRFMYVLPFSKTTALVEYTLFSEHLLEKAAYEKEIKSYLEEKYDILGYEILDVEFGSIPMTSYPFHKKNTNRMLGIGVAGGWAKPSTGFTFHNTSRQVKKLVNHLKKEKPLVRFHTKSRFEYYDMLLLDVLHRDNHRGRSVFESMFKKISTPFILRFLDNQTTFWEELIIINSCPKIPFLRALWKRLF